MTDMNLANEFSEFEELEAMFGQDKMPGGIYHKIQIDLTYNSNHIEGSRLTHDQTRYIFETNTIGFENESVNVDDVIETSNHFRCIDMVIDQAGSALTEKFIKELHFVLKTGTSDSRKDWFKVGEYKKLPNEVGGNDTTLPEDVAGEMRKMLADYNALPVKTFEDIVAFHVAFERIHPFQDGNGRVGRLILFKECLKNNIVPFIIEDNLKLFYYRGLKEWDHEKGFLMDTCLTAQDRFKAYNAGCRHEDEQCDAYLLGMGNRPMYFYNDRLYYIDVFEPTLYSRNAIGMELTKVATLGTKYLEEQKVVEIRSGAIAGGYLYYGASVSTVTLDENGVNVHRVEREYIGRVNLSTGKDEILIEEFYDNQHERLILCAVRANGILLNRWEGIEDIDRNDPAYTDLLGKIPVTLEHWNGETGETTVLFRKTIRECSGIKKVSNGKVYFTTFGSIQAEDAGHTYSYDLNTEKEEKVCPYRTSFQLCGSYTLCYDAEENVMLFDMAAGKTLPYELGSVAYAYNVSDKGCVIGYYAYAEDVSGQERRFYYVTLDSLADGLQEADLQYMYTF